jgi:hypothetical protein
MNTIVIWLGVKPWVFKIAISPRLSVTTITRVETILKAATATINNKIINITRFSVLIA